LKQFVCEEQFKLNKKAFILFCIAKAEIGLQAALVIRGFDIRGLLIAPQT